MITWKTVTIQHMKTVIEIKKRRNGSILETLCCFEDDIKWKTFEYVASSYHDLKAYELKQEIEECFEELKYLAIEEAEEEQRS